MTIIETWANPAVIPATVPAGAAAVPAGTPERWDMAGGWAQFPAASAAAWPPVKFRIFDLNNPPEIILVETTAGPAWDVIRGDAGTTPVDHPPGFAVHNVITGPGMANLAQGVPSGNGLVLPAAGRRAAAEGALAAELFPVAALPVPAFEATPGSVYELLAFGYFWTGGGTQNLHAELTWTGAAPLAAGTWQLIPNPPGIVPGNPANVPPRNPPGAAAGPDQSARWRAHGLISFYGGAGPATFASGSLLLQLGDSIGPATQHLDLIAGDTTPAGVPVATTGPAAAQMALQLVNNGGGGRIFVTGGKAWRAG
jgi:hypothetical protein